MDYSSAGRLEEDSKLRSGTKVTTTKPRNRPQSQASTASAHSVMTQPQGEPIDRANEYPNNWYDRSAQEQQSLGPVNNQISSEEDMVMRSASQLQNPYEIDPALVGRGNHELTYPQESHYYPGSSRPLHPDGVHAQSYVEPDSQIIEGRSDEQDDAESVAGATGAGKKGAKTSAANELEMRALFQANRHRSLPEVAKELHGNERGPQSERQRQVFAMLWINQVCSKGKGSVPRSRVYSYYVSRCATERVTVLNPASFGKLVRVLFPGLKTRRLGVRGESKYHYVNFSLQEDQPSLREVEQEQNQPLQAFQSQTNLAQNFSLSYPAQYSGDRAAFPPLDVPQPSNPAAQQSQGLIKPYSLYTQPQTEDLINMEMATSKISQRLGFAPLVQPPAQEYEPLALPKIEPFVPAGTDPDAATALTALYRSHCTSLVECVRFCKEKTFFHLFTSFHGTLTMPVQKLFAHPSIAPWIEECDFVMYQKMVRVASHLTLQVAPPAVLATLKNISLRLVPHIRSSFNGQPNHVINAKVAPATLFAGLLDRELRVNLTAHAAANMLVNQQIRDQMYLDWITLVRTRKIAECVPTRGMDDLVTLFLTEIRGLLEPLTVPWELEKGTLYGQMAERNGQHQQAPQQNSATQENTLDRWVNFLLSLPQKFPYASHAEILWGVQQVGTAVMRDITMEQGKSFASWWVTKCWIDEMIAFMVEQGGFMEYKNSRTTHAEASKQAQSQIKSQLEARYSTGSEDFLRENTHGDPATSIPRPINTTSPDTSNAVAAHDDSGIGIRTPEDDFAMEKYDFVTGEAVNEFGQLGASHVQAP